MRSGRFKLVAFGSFTLVLLLILSGAASAATASRGSIGNAINLGGGIADAQSKVARQLAVSPSSVHGPYNVRAFNSNKCLDVRGGTGATANGTVTQIYTCLGPNQTNQQWYFVDTGLGSYWLVAVNSGRCLDVRGGLPSPPQPNGTVVQIWDCFNDLNHANQRWVVDTPYANNITSVNTGRCLDVRGGPGATANGTPIQIWDCLGLNQTNQRWTLTIP